MLQHTYIYTHPHIHFSCDLIGKWNFSLVEVLNVKMRGLKEDFPFHSQLHLNKDTSIYFT